MKWGPILLVLVGISCCGYFAVDRWRPFWNAGGAPIYFSSSPAVPPFSVLPTEESQSVTLPSTLAPQRNTKHLDDRPGNSTMLSSEIILQSIRGTLDFVDRIDRPIPAITSEMVQTASITDNRLLNGTKVISGDACSVILRDVVISVRDGVRVRSYGDEGVRVPACTIDNKKVGHVWLRAYRETEVRKNKDCAPLVFISNFFRPQHAMQFLFSFIASFSLAAEYSIPFSTVPLYFSLMPYGEFGKWDDFMAYRKKFPHLELLRLFSGTPPQLFVEKDWAKFVVKPPIGVKEALQKEFSGHLLKEQIQRDLIPFDGRKLYCFKYAIYGALPFRIPGPKGLLPTLVRPRHWQALRLRLIEYFDLKLLPSSQQYAVVVDRKSRGRSLVGVDNVLQNIRASVLPVLFPNENVSVKLVQWEGMTMKEQLQVIINTKFLLGAHGNGLVWACFMPLESYLVEFTSRIKHKNEVRSGINATNAGNVASACGMKSISATVPWRENEKSKGTKVSAPGHHWKDVDLVVREVDLDDVVKQLTQMKTGH